MNRWAAPSHCPRVAVVLPVRNEEATLQRCLASLRAQTYRPLEVIVVDDGSTDGTPDIVRRFPEVRLLRGAGRGPSLARNRAVALTGADIVAFTDGDCVCHRRWVEALVDVLRRGEVAGAGGDQVCAEDESPYGRRVHRFLKAVGFVGDYVRDSPSEARTEHNPTCNVAYWRQVLLDLGGFDERLWPGEDVDLDHRLRRRGHGLAFTPRAQVAHYRPATPADFSKMMRAYGRAQAYLVRKHGPFRPLHLLPLAELGGAVALLSPASPLALTGLALAPLWLLRSRGYALAELPAAAALFWRTVLCWNRGFAEGMLDRSFAGRARGTAGEH